LVGDGELVGSHGQTAPLLEPVDTAFDRVALLECFDIEGGRAASGTASPQPMADLVGGLRDDSADPASAEAYRVATPRQAFNLLIRRSTVFRSL